MTSITRKIDDIIQEYGSWENYQQSLNKDKMEKMQLEVGKLPDFSEREMHVAAHAVGINLYHAIQSKKKKDKKLPAEFYRNYFAAGENHSDILHLKQMVGNGLMERWDVPGQSFSCYGLTEIGEFKFRKQFIREVTVQTTKQE